MDKITIYQKPACSTCKEVCQILKDANVDFESVDYYTAPVPKTKLRELAQKLGTSLKDLVRTKEQVYRDLRLAEKNLTEEQLLDLIVIYPDLLQRPIVERGEKAVLAKPARKVKEFLASSVSPDASQILQENTRPEN
ncbi:MAG: Arsenate reductase [Candidatus Omnitrophica bacterium ADurb.Bin277]|nr:MAG: Arsenate reductase [Candidatus Omnitrophica bacterium ADurb.Bin277]